MKTIEAIAITGLVLLACGSTASAGSATFGEINLQQKGKQVQTSADELMQKPGRHMTAGEIRQSRIARGLPVRPLRNRKPGGLKPDFTKPDFNQPTILCGPRSGLQQILDLLKGKLTCS